MLFIILSIALSALPAFSAGYAIELDSAKINCDAIFTSSTVYLKCEDVAKALKTPYDFDEKLNCAFFGGIYLLAEKNDSTVIYSNGKIFTPTNDAGEKIQPLMQNGKMYLPAHTICEIFSLTPSWSDTTHTLSLSSNSEGNATAVVKEGEIYALINKETGNAITVSETEMNLSATEFTKSKNQEFQFVKTEFDGFYHIQSTLTGKNLDVLSHGTTPGVSIITWEAGTGDNQKFAIENIAGGTLIYARSCSLPIEENSGSIMQNSRSEYNSQKWIIAPFNTYTPNEKSAVKELKVTYIPPEPTEEELKAAAPYRTFSVSSSALTASSSLCTAPDEKLQAQKWALEDLGGKYIITNAQSGKALDVSGLSTEPGGSIITYTPNRDLNQQWILEENPDGTYFIKSVHSSLYLTASSDGVITQEAKNPALLQNWTMDFVY